MKRTWRTIAVLFLAAAAGCAASSKSALDRNADPTDSAAPSAPVPRGGEELRADDFDRQVFYAELAVEPERSGVPDPDVDAPAEAPAPGHQHDAGTPAAKKPAAERTPAPAPRPALYVCPMHPEVTDDKPSKCPKCGMTLVLQKEKP